jgi:glutamyl-tRNA synthetase
MAGSKDKIVTRFAPSPTGFLHIGGARTALFNWLFTRGRQGTFRLRIEDTDRARSTEAAITAILDGLSWLGLDWDGEVVYQSKRIARHREVADELLSKDKAYRCFASPDELEAMRDAARKAGKPMRYDGRWRDRDPKEAPQGVKPVIRLKSPREGATTIEDTVQGAVTVPNAELDDMVLLRSDGTPTYMLSVVVDDHDMGITHVIRGDDHFTNAFRQTHIYGALGWDVPLFAHVPLIHGPDGAKLSKRHGALGVEAYRDMGYLPETLRNYLARLGWGHKDHEIFTSAQAMEWFTLEAIGKSPARFDPVRLENLNGHYIRAASDQHLFDVSLSFLESELGRSLEEAEKTTFLRAMPGLKERAKALKDISQGAAFYFAKRPLSLNDQAKTLLNPPARAMLGRLAERLKPLSRWRREALSDAIKAFAEAEGEKLGAVAQPARAALSGSNISPSIFEVMEVLGKEESLARIADQAK